MDYRVSDLAKAAVMLGTRFRNWAPLDPRSSATSWKDTGSSTVSHLVKRRRYSS